ncbi:hypothetical protein H5410_052338 [Solanum commersonii]|uniref:Uncharacterized protein n=1 Tax=Solanum commersonii TaxID=4109 RepID=A0A9J5X1Y1_SOLCO|nr:hypothetical protein H5410_052338 [Solanum commersonii]
MIHPTNHDSTKSPSRRELERISYHMSSTRCKRRGGKRSETARGKRFASRVGARWLRLGRLWLSLVRLSMFRNLFIDLLRVWRVRVSSMLNFYSSFRPYFEKMLDYDKDVSRYY